MAHITHPFIIPLRDKFLGDAADFAAGFADEAHDHYKRVVAKYICSDLSEYVATKPQNLVSKECFLSDEMNNSFTLTKLK